ncbi:MAG: M14 metallopeptidase family protein [Pacificimonas sp.]|jgi:hypothetical protein|nr:M14 metallopeptidase family protein [Pacificimonas sp.]
MFFRLIATLSVLWAAPAAAQSVLPGTFDPAIPTLEAVVGFPTGEEIVSVGETMRYFDALAAAAPDRMQITQYAESWQGRPLVYGVISSAENMARIDEIRAQTARLASGRLSAAERQRLSSELPPVTWLAYGVHGNEISSTDAALSLAYHLLASEGDEQVDRILRETIVVIDPVQNPDGRERFVHDFYSELGLEPWGDRFTAEHDLPWPSGRVNHYMFDMNRDWFAATQPETQGRVAAVRAWNPVVLADVHEMGGDQTYFFPPAADPFNPNFLQSQKDKQEVLGLAMAAEFDRRGIPYFTREIFDAFYPGFGDSWPTLNGAIAMTFEQGSARGLLYDRSDGTVLTYPETVRNQFLSTLVTADTVARNPEYFLSGLADRRASAVSEGARGGDYVLDLADGRWTGEQLARRLAQQGIEVRKVDGPASLCGRPYPDGAIVVESAQGAGRLVKTLFDVETPLPAAFLAEQEERRARGLDFQLYDVTAWSVPLMSGLGVARCEANGGRLVDVAEPIPAAVSGTPIFGWAVPWDDTGQARLVTLALREGLEARATDTAFTAQGQRFGRGTTIFSAGMNTPEQLQRLRALAEEVGAEMVGLASGWVDDGPNLGSGAFQRLSAPKVAMVWGEGTSPLSAGALRFVLEQRLGVPVAPIRTRTVSRADLDLYDVMIVPNGTGKSDIGDGGLAALKGFAERGGVLVGVGSSLLMLADEEDGVLPLVRETALGEAASGEAEGEAAEAKVIESEAEYRAAIRDPDALPEFEPGALLNTVADPESLLTAGYREGPVVLANGNLVFSPLSADEGTNVLRYADADDLVASGHVFPENQRQMAYKPYMVAAPEGRGMVIGFVHDPSTRGYLNGLDMLLANSVLLAPSRVR